jgi:predicted enzyme related to lactoylglutathione lyase
MSDLSKKELVFRGVRGVALPVLDETRARHFYENVLKLPVAMQDGEPIGYLIGETILLLKKDWYAPPSPDPSPRVTLEVDDSRATEKELGERGVTIADKVEKFGISYIGSFLDSEGNKLWFCSYA